MPTFEVKNHIYILKHIKEREDAMTTDKKVRSKHIGYSAQREQCRLNKYTYIEKINGAAVLFCNYPFDAPGHKKGLCKAGTCTDMREIPADVVAADVKVEVPEEVKPEDTTKTEDTTDNG